MGKYGVPAVSSERLLVWYDVGSTVRLELHRDAVPHKFPMLHQDYLTSTVMYDVPNDKLDELAEYDGSVWFHRTRGYLSAQCDQEAMNFLALNLAHDLVQGTRTVADARAFFARTAMAYKNGDRTSPYVNGLTFSPMPMAADAGHPVSQP